MVAAEELARGDILGAAMHGVRAACLRSDAQQKHALAGGSAPVAVVSTATAPVAVASMATNSRLERQAASEERRAMSQGMVAAEELARGDILGAAMHGVRAACLRSDAQQKRSNCSTPQGEVVSVPPQPPTLPAPPPVLPTSSSTPPGPSPLLSTTLAASTAGPANVSNEAVRAGWVQKRSVSAISFLKNWKLRYLTLRALSIEWSESEGGPRKGVLYTPGAHVRPSSVQPTNGSGDGGSLSIMDRSGRELVLYFPTQAELQDWQASIVNNCAATKS